MPGVAGAAAIGGVASIASGLISQGSARKASQAQQAQQQQALAEQRRLAAMNQQNLQPFIDAGQGGLQGLVEGSTAQGLDARLAEIFAGGTFQNLVGERTRAVQSGLGAAGLTRSGAGIQQLAAVPSDLGLQLEQLLSGRQGGLAGIGQQSATQLGGLAQGNVNAQSALLQNIGQTQAQGILGQGQTDAAQQQALIQGISQLAGAGIGAFGGGGGGNVGLNDVGGVAIAQGASPSNPIATNTGQFQGPVFPVG